MGEVNFRLSKREAKALLDPRDPPCWHRKSQLRRAAEFKLNSGLLAAFPELRQPLSSDEEGR